MATLMFLFQASDDGLPYMVASDPTECRLQSPSALGPQQGPQLGGVAILGLSHSPAREPCLLEICWDILPVAISPYGDFHHLKGKRSSLPLLPPTTLAGDNGSSWEGPLLELSLWAYSLP